MPEYYAMGHEQPVNPGNLLDIKLDTKKAKIVGAKAHSYSLYEKPTVVDIYAKDTLGIPQGALVMLLEYSLGKYYLSKRYKLNKYLPKKKLIIFSNVNGNSIISSMGVSTPKGLEGKIVEAVLQNNSIVGIKISNK